VVVYHVPTEGATQLRSAQCVDGAAGIVLTSDIREPPAVTSDEGPHGHAVDVITRACGEFKRIQCNYLDVY